jgi:hypothetical protein
MIQRIQSVWLLLASICAFLTLKLPFYAKPILPGNTYFELKGTESYLLMILTIALGVIAFINIFLYKNRVVQLRFSVLGIIIDLIIVALYLQTIKDFTTGTFSFYWILHPVILVTLFLAARGIRKDQKMIKDSDRLR